MLIRAAGFAALRRVVMLPTAVCAGLSVAVGVAGSAFGQAAITPEQMSWFKANAVPLKTVEAGHGLEDLARLTGMIGDAKIVGLGEGTHGTREHFQAKHRLIEFLVEEMGFGIFSIEANMPESYALNDYVLGGEGDVNKLIAGMYFWTWNTEEVRDMVEWMRAYNARQKAAGSDRRIQFTGFDMQTKTVAQKIAVDFLEKHDPEFLKEFTPSLEKLETYNPFGGSGGGFGCATGQFPVEQARGKKVKFTGWIKSENVKDAWAGLWWRVDGPTPVFDNMQNRGPRGTTDWTEYTIELDVPADAKAIFFGLVMPGTGRAWFDGLKIELDGQPWSNEAFDLDFEGGAMKGLVPADPSGGAAPTGYKGSLDVEVAKSGKQSFRLESVESKAMSAADAGKITYKLYKHMRDSRDRYAAATDARTADWAIQNARVMDQWAGLGNRQGGGYNHRDKCMADNVDWIAEQNPGERIVLWAHNGHMQFTGAAMGAHLRETHGSDYMNVGFCSSHGEYWAVRKGGKGQGVCTLAQPAENSFESVLEASGEPILLIDLRAARDDDPGSAWLTEERPFGGMIGALEMTEHYYPTRIKDSYDLLLYVKDTTAARRLAKKN